MDSAMKLQTAPEVFFAEQSRAQLARCHVPNGSCTNRLDGGGITQDGYIGFR